MLRAALTRESTAWSFVEGAPFAAVPLTIHPCEDAGTWQRGAEAERGGPLQTDRYLWRATLLDAGYRDAEARRFSSGFVLSDLGAQGGGPEVGALRLEGFDFLTCNAGGVMAVMVFVTTIGDRMHCAFTYHEPLLRARSVDSYADAMLASLRAAVP